MADRLSTPTRRGMLGVIAAASTVAAAPAIAAPASGARDAWDQAKRVYECRMILQNAVEKYGDLYEASNERATAAYAAKAVFGTMARARADKATAEKLDAAVKAENDACDRWMDQEVEPADAAGIRLVLTPAPDVEAIQYKMMVIGQLSMHTADQMPRNCVEVIREDIARLGVLN